MRRIRNHDGLSIIEVLSAVGVFSLVAASITSSVVSNIKINTRGRTTSAAAALAQDKIEHLRNIVPDPVTNAVPADLTAGTHTDPGNPLTALGDTNGTFTRIWTVGGVPQYLNGTVVGNRPGVVLVSVTVSWPQPLAGSVTAVTYACTTPTCG
jgi:type II secretory pathway pseudopilin PulG